MSKIVYNCLIQVNTRNSHIRKNFPLLVKDMEFADFIILSSRDYLDFKDCLDEAVTSLEEKLDKINSNSNTDVLKLYWEKNNFDGELDSLDEEWLTDELIKIHASSKDSNIDENWIFKARFFHRKLNEVHDAPFRLQ